MAKARKKSKKKIIIFSVLGALLVVIIALVVLAGNKENIVTVQTEKVENRTITQIVSATGKINPIEQVVLRPEVTGEIVELPVEEGDKVSKGQLLIRLKPDQYIARRNRARESLKSAQSNLKVSEATFTQVESEYKRVQGLHEKGLASEKELEMAKSSFLQSSGTVESQNAQVAQANENYKDAEVELAKTAIYAPLEGTISQLNVEMSERVLGSSFSQGTHLMTVADLNQIEARVDVNENDVVKITVGDTTNIEIDAFRDRKFNGLVTHIGNSAITAGLGSQEEVVNFKVRVKLLDLDDKIKPGMSCDADIETETKIDVLTVPIQSVTARLDDSEEENSNGESNNMSSKKLK